MSRKIRRIELIDFQCHQHTVLDLHEGLNIICGPTEYGKSSILRALHWVFYNTWDDSYIRSGENKTIVRVYYDDGHVIEKTRNRSGSINRYTLSYPDGTQLQLDKFGNQVPKQVEEIHRMTPWVLDEDVVLNPKFRIQSDPVFLIFERGAVRAKAVGHVAGVHIFDAAIREANLELTRLNREEKALEEKLAYHIQEKSKYITLEEEEKKLVQAKRDFEELEETLDILERAKTIVASLEALRTQIEKWKQVVTSLRRVESQLSLSAVLEEMFEKYCQAKHLLTSVRTIQERKQHLADISDKMREAETYLSLHEFLQHMTEKRDEVRRRLSRLDALQREKMNHVRVVERCRTVDHSIEANQHLIRKAEKLQEIHSRFHDLRIVRERLQKLRQIRQKIASAEEMYDKSHKLEFELLRLIEARERYHRLQQVKTEIQKYRRLAEQASEKEKEALKKYEEILHAVGENCPVCMRPMDENVIRHAAHLMQQQVSIS